MNLLHCMYFHICSVYFKDQEEHIIDIPISCPKINLRGNQVIKGIFLPLEASKNPSTEAI